MECIQESSRRQGELHPHRRSDDNIGRRRKQRSCSGQVQFQLESGAKCVMHVAMNSMKDTAHVRA